MPEAELMPDAWTALIAGRTANASCVASVARALAACQLPAFSSSLERQTAAMVAAQLDARAFAAANAAVVLD